MRRAYGGLVAAVLFAVLIAGSGLGAAAGDDARDQGAPGSAATCTVPPALTGRVIVSNQESSSATIVDLSSGTPEVTQLTVGDENHGADVSADGKWGVVADYGVRQDGGPPGGVFNGNRLFVVDLAAKRVVRTVSTGEHRGLHDVSFLPGSSARLMVTAQRTREVVLVDIARGEVLDAFPTDGNGSHSLAISPDGSWLATSNEESGDITLIDLRGAAMDASSRPGGMRRGAPRRLAMPARPFGIAFSRDGGELWVGVEGSVRVLDARTLGELAVIEGIPFADDIMMSADGRWAVASTGPRGVYLLDVPARHIAHRFPQVGNASVIAGDSRVAWLALGREHRIVAVDLVGRCEIASFAAGRFPDKLGWAKVD